MKRQLLQKIIEGVEKDGYYEVSLELMETVLEQGDRRSPHSKEEILTWAAEHNLDHEYREGEAETLIRFSRK